MMSVGVQSPALIECAEKCVVEGEGDWGDVIGFVVEDNKVIYVGMDYLSY